MSEWGVLFGTVRSFLVARLPGFILSRMYSEEILEGISVAQLVEGALADTYVPAEGQHCVSNAVLGIHNHLPFKIRVETLEGRLLHNSSVIVRNFSIAIRAEVKDEWKHHWSYDLPQGHGLDNRASESVFFYDIDGDLLFTAIGKQFKKRVSVKVWSWLHKS